MTERKFVSVQFNDEKLIAVADDGTAWIANTQIQPGPSVERLAIRVATNWIQLKPLPPIGDQ